MGQKDMLRFWNLDLCHRYRASEGRLTIFKPKKKIQEGKCTQDQNEIKQEQRKFWTRRRRNKSNNKALKGGDKRKKNTHSRGITQRIQGDVYLLQKNNKVSKLYPIKNI